MANTSRFAKIFRLSSFPLLLMIIGSLGIDQASKFTAEQELMVWQDPDNLKHYQGRRLPIWSIGTPTSPGQNAENFYLGFNFNYIRNQGAAWGMLSDLDDQYRIPFFFCMTLFAISLISFYFISTPPHHRLARFAFALVLSGALGNFTDRVLRGYVIDFLDVRWTIPLAWNQGFTLPLLNWSVGGGSWSYNFPNFNWADSTISIGVLLLLIDLAIFEPKRSSS